MHKKSLEASKKIREEESREEVSESRDFRSESIAQLRAKAQEHNAKLLQALNKSDQEKHSECSNNSFDGSFFSDTMDTTELIRS